MSAPHDQSRARAPAQLIAVRRHDEPDFVVTQEEAPDGWRIRAVWRTRIVAIQSKEAHYDASA